MGTPKVVAKNSLELPDFCLTFGRSLFCGSVLRGMGGSVDSAATPVLEVRGLVKEFPGVKALVGVDFDVRASEVRFLLGLNGARKSTLIKCVSGVVEPTGGEIYLRGELLPVGDPAGSLERGVATIYQELDLVDDLTVAQSVFLAHEPRRGPLLTAIRDDSAVAPTARPLRTATAGAEVCDAILRSAENGSREEVSYRDYESARTETAAPPCCAATRRPRSARRRTFNEPKASTSSRAEPTAAAVPLLPRE
jgi:ABC-type sugar transport system ATPase subunit